MVSQLKFKRVLLKLSGEALMGAQGYGIDPLVCERMAEIMVRALQSKAQVKT